MRVNRISINDFRGFPGPRSYEFLLAGKNLLLFGENGSGKSSMVVALREFFNLSINPHPFSIFKNVFTPVPLGSAAGGHVSIEFDSGGGKYTWDAVSNVRPTSNPVVAGTALRFGFLDYRAMQKANSVYTAGSPNLFEFLIDGVLRPMQVLSKGRNSTLGKLLDNMRAVRPRRHTSKQLNVVDNACDALNTAMKSYVPGIVTEANAIMAAFGNHGVRFDLSPGTVAYSRELRKFHDERLDVVAELHGTRLREPQHFLNEARLSALALSVYLAALRLSVPPAPPGAPDPARIMILDDVLVGLDMSNRQPLLAVLKSKFADWQVILLTHDQAWFAIAKSGVSKDSWRFGRLSTTFNGVYDVPVLVDESDFIDRAREYLNVYGDERAAGVYLRLAFEQILKETCDRLAIRVAYHHPYHHANTQTFWGPVKEERRGRDPLVDAGLIADVEACRRNVANPLCHFGVLAPYRAEVETAINVLERLKLLLAGVPERRELRSNTFLEDAIKECSAAAAGFSASRAAVFLRSAFDQAVSNLAIRKRLMVPYSGAGYAHTTSDLWRGLMVAPTMLSAAYAREVAAVQIFGNLFLGHLDPSDWSARPQIDLQAALAALSPADALVSSSGMTVWLDRVP